MHWLRVGVEYNELARGVAEAEHVLVEQLHVPLRLHLPRGRSMLSRRCYCRCRWRWWWWRRGTGCGVGVTFSPLTNVPLVDPRSITYGRTILVGPPSVSFSVKRNWITACCGRGGTRSARDRAEIAPRSRRDRAEIAPRSRRDRACDEHEGWSSGMSATRLSLPRRYADCRWMWNGSSSSFP